MGTSAPQQVASTSAHTAAGCGAPADVPSSHPSSQFERQHCNSLTCDYSYPCCLSSHLTSVLSSSSRKEPTFPFHRTQAIRASLTRMVAAICPASPSFSHLQLQDFFLFLLQKGLHHFGFVLRSLQLLHLLFFLFFPNSFFSAIWERRKLMLGTYDLSETHQSLGHHACWSECSRNGGADQQASFL